MSGTTAIEWTDATWNPVTGCTKVGAGCDHCYAERFAERWRGVAGHAYERGFDVQRRPERLAQPLAWRRPRRVFVNSMGDLFHKRVPRAFVDEVFGVMEAADRHVFQLLTKRSSRMRDYVNAHYRRRSAPAHLWLGVSIEDETKRARAQHLRAATAAVRFLSLEPLLGPLPALDLDGIHWVIVGGESGPGARPMRAEWARALRDQCAARAVPFFFKQWGGVRPKAGGRVLDGQEWSEWPAAPAAALAAA